MNIIYLFTVIFISIITYPGTLLLSLGLIDYLGRKAFYFSQFCVDIVAAGNKFKSTYEMRRKERV